MGGYVFNNKPKSRMRFEFENPVQEATGPFEEVWRVFNQRRIDGSSDRTQDRNRFNKMIVKWNLIYVAKNTCIAEWETQTKLASYN